MEIKKLPIEDRPREKWMRIGKNNLTDTELMAILIGSGSRDESALVLARRMLSKYDYQLNLLSKLTFSEISQFRGIGPAKAIRIMAAFELGRRKESVASQDVKSLASSKAVFDYVRPTLTDLRHEEFRVIFLNRGCRVLAFELIGQGGYHATVVDVRLIFKRALELSATSIILAHNHPSGSLRPSPADVQLTRRIQEAGRFLSIDVSDHLIVCDNAYYSFRDQDEL